MFSAALLPEKCVITAASAQFQRESALFLFFPSTFSTLQFSKNIRILMSLPCGCACENVFRFVHVELLFVCMHARTEGWMFLLLCVCVCVCLSQCALIQYSNAPAVLLHQGNIKSSSITASPCFTNFPPYIDWEPGLIIRRGEIPFRTARTQTPASYSATLPFHKAWYLMHRCGSRQWWTVGKDEVDVPLAECKAVKTDGLWNASWGEMERDRGRKVRGLRNSGEKCKGDWEKER